jgi:signal transduction histidine kinase/DNA-binding response OmpR family regulator
MDVRATIKSGIINAHKPAQILIVDDHEDNVALLRMILRSQGYTILTASDGLQALDVVQQTQPDLILLDVMMPRMSGYEVIEEVRRNHEVYIPIMLITAKQDLSDKVKGLEVGADDFLPKPVQSAELIAKVRALLRLKQVQDELMSERDKNEMLCYVGQQLNSTLDVDQLVRETLNVMVNLIGATQGSVLIKHPRQQTWRKITTTLEGNLTHHPDETTLVLAQGLAGLALREREPILVTDTLNDSRWLPLDDFIGPVRTALAIPLIHNHIELGVLTLMHKEPERFREDQMPMVSSVAAQVVSALYNASLYTQLKQAEAAREYVVHMLTHDLRAPLAGIMGCLHVLGVSVQDPDCIEFVELARKACEAQEELINDILDVYRAESGLLELAKVPFQPSDLKGSVLDQLSGAAAERKLKLSIDLPEEPTIVADIRKLSRVLVNLVNNAIKFTRRGGVYITATHTEPGSDILFTVRDTGVGIAPGDVAHIFDRFFQARQEGARRGSGLGLNFCREVVRAHGGEIWAESQLDVGTTIYFTIPIEGNFDDQVAIIDRR